MRKGTSDYAKAKNMTRKQAGQILRIRGARKHVGPTTSDTLWELNES